MRRAIVIASMLAGLALVVPAAAAADLHIGRGQVVSDIKVIGDDVRLDGRARGRVIIVDGNLLVGPTGVAKDVTIIGGHVRSEPGARLQGDVVQIGGSWPQPDSWQFLVAVAMFVAVRLLAVWLVVAAADLLAGQASLAKVSDTARSRPLRTFAVGALAVFGLGAASLILAITLVGLAVAAALWGLLLLASVTGVALALSGVAERRTARRLAFVALAIPILGDGLAALAAVVGLGALLRFASDARPQAVPESAFGPR